jgi:DNA polymerase-3 subunit delta
MRGNSVEVIERNILRPVYLLSSDEPLLRDEALGKIKIKAQKEAFNTIQSFEINAQFKWGNLFSELQQSDLFSEKKLFILNLPSPKLNAETAKAFTEYFSQTLTEGVIFVFITKKLEATVLKSKWLEALDDRGYIIQLFSPEPAQLKNWISARATQNGLNLSPQALGWIVELTEGNLTASSQVIERLFLEYGSGSLISDEQLKESLFDSTQYSIYDLVDHWLQGNKLNCLKILARLRKEAAEPTLILWALMTECRTLAKIQFDLDKGESLNMALNTHRVWQKRQPLLKQHLKTQCDYANLLQQYLSPIEHVVKGAAKGNVWDLFERFLIDGAKP